MTAEQRADVLMEQMPYQLGHLGYNYRQALVLAIKEAMRDQRHACAEALLECNSISTVQDAISSDDAHLAVMNAEPGVEE